LTDPGKICRRPGAVHSPSGHAAITSSLQWAITEKLFGCRQSEKVRPAFRHDADLPEVDAAQRFDDTGKLIAKTDRAAADSRLSPTDKLEAIVFL
jgi:hypothetical protein